LFFFIKNNYNLFALRFFAYGCILDTVHNAFFAEMKGYKLKYLPKDLFAGLMVSLAALPFAISLGYQSGLTIHAGLAASFAGGFILSFLSGSKYTAGGPSVTFVAVTLTCVSNPEIGFEGMLLACFFGGIILIIMGLCRFGKLFKYVPLPVIVGFTSGVAILLFASLAKDFFGLDFSPLGKSDFIPKIKGLIEAAPSVNGYAVLISVVCVGLIFLIRGLNKKLPAVFIVITMATLFSFIMAKAFPNKNYFPTIGSSYGRIRPEVTFINFAKLKSIKFYLLLFPMFMFAFLATTEGLMAAAVTTTSTGESHCTQMELVGHGVANMASAVFGGIPVTGAWARTSFNVKNGAKSPISGMFAAVCILVMYFVLMPVIKYIPFAALAAVLTYVSINMGRFRVFGKIITSKNVIDTSTLIITFSGVILLGVAYGVVIGVFLFHGMRWIKILIDKKKQKGETAVCK